MSTWPLAIPNMTLWDKLKIGKWLLTESQWTQGKYVRAYEERWEQYTGAPHVIMVANGSVANELIALRRKWELQQAGEWPRRNKVVFPVVNWISSISPWINLGFEPIFMDVGANLTSTSDQVDAILWRDDLRPQIAAVFYTSLLGFTGGVESILHGCRAANVPLYLDNCEASFTEENGRHISNLVTSSTSLYFSHHTSGEQEGGLIFTQTDEENDWYRMARNHGMTRGMPAKYHNPEIDPMFDFYMMGSNYRSSNLLAYMCSLDLDRALAFRPWRSAISFVFTLSLDGDRFERPHDSVKLNGGSIPLSLPIICIEPGLIIKVKAYLKEQGIEFRPIVTGNLLRQTAFKAYGNPTDFPRAEHIHHNGIYIGLHKGVTIDMVSKLARQLSSL